MGKHGQLGPLDIQLGKKDELWETDSGLTVLTAIETLEVKAFELFEDCLLELKKRSGDRISLRTASEVATNLAIGIVTPIVSQIDPLHVGEVSRALKIGLEYGKRLDAFSKNAKENTIDNLTNKYPSHDFIIDLAEAKKLFKNAREPNEDESFLMNMLGYGIREPRGEDPLYLYISNPNGGKSNDTSDNAQDVGGGQETSGEGVGATGGAGEGEIAIQNSDNVTPFPTEGFQGAA